MIAGNSINTNYAPTVGATEVERFFRDLRQTVVNLENAYRREILPVFLPRVDLEAQFGTALFNVYWRLVRRPFIKDPQGRRIETVFALLEQMRDELLEWVQFEAVRSTKALRQWEADGGTFQRRSDGRLSARSGFQLSEFSGMQEKAISQYLGHVGHH